MKIKSIDIFNCELKLKKVFITSLGPIQSSHHIFIRVVLEDGTYGWGECAPSNTINGENIKTCLSIAPDLCKSILTFFYVRNGRKIIKFDIRINMRQKLRIKSVSRRKLFSTSL